MDARVEGDHIRTMSGNEGEWELAARAHFVETFRPLIT